MKTVITYKNADLDCVASAYAYSEFLNKINDKCNYFIGGIIQKEVDIVCSLFNIELTSAKNINKNQIIVVDTNTMSSIDFVDSKNIIEIIDHHPRSNDIFENAIIEIEQIGAVCTIITEKFKNNNINISRNSALLLYYGIVSNTVNFNSNVTTEKDVKMANWLKKQCSEINDSLISKIFAEKSKVDINDLRRAMEVEEKFILGSNELIIGQLEITNAKLYLKKYKSKIDKILNDVKNDYGVSLIFLNIVDILNGYHIIYSPFVNTRKFLKNEYQIEFVGDIFFENKIVLRKEIKQYLKSILENKY